MMDRIREGLLFVRGRRVGVDAFRRAFSDMLLMGLVSKGYVQEGEFLKITDAGQRLLADRG